MHEWIWEGGESRKLGLPAEGNQETPPCACSGSGGLEPPFAAKLPISRISEGDI